MCPTSVSVHDVGSAPAVAMENQKTQVRVAMTTTAGTKTEDTLSQGLALVPFAAQLGHLRVCQRGIT